MFKVSFKETPKNPSKLVTKVGNETTVLLKGIVEIPDFWKHLPEEIVEWIAQAKHLEGYEDVAKNQLIIYSKGITKCHPEDHYDTVLGDRMAESRAKYHIYKFFYDLSYKLTEYYGNLIYGVEGAVVSSTDNGLMGTAKKYEKLYMRELRHQRELLEKKQHG